MDKKYSIAHELESSKFAPNGYALWRDPQPPSPDKMGNGSIRACAYCGSMHPTDVVAALKAGARPELADMKYGWPHKIYLNNVPNPFVGMPQTLSETTFPYKNYIQVAPDRWIMPPTPAPETRTGKFYIVHLMDATPEEKEFIEVMIGYRFTILDDQIVWNKE